MSRTIFKVACNSFRHWRSSSRYLLLFLLLFAFLWWALEPIKALAYSTGYAVNPILLPFFLGSEVYQLIVGLGILFLFANAPFLDELQLYVFQRTGRRLWVTGQILYVLAATAVYLIALAVFSLIIIAPVATWDTEGWGKIVSTLAYTNAASSIHLNFLIPEKVITETMPLSALGIQLVLEYLALAVIGLLAFAINLFSPYKIGLYLGGIVCLFDLLITNILPRYLFSFSPLSLARLPVVDFSGSSVIYPSITWAMCFNLLCIVTIIIVVFISSYRMTIQLIPDLQE